MNVSLSVERRVQLHGATVHSAAAASVSRGGGGSGLSHRESALDNGTRRIASRMAQCSPEAAAVVAPKETWTMTELVLESLDQGVLTLTLNRPAQRNGVPVKELHKVYVIRFRLDEAG